MAISPQQLTIYLYSAHRAVIFAIAQLSCISSHGVSLWCDVWRRRHSSTKSTRPDRDLWSCWRYSSLQRASYQVIC